VAGLSRALSLDELWHRHYNSQSENDLNELMAGCKRAVTKQLSAMVQEDDLDEAVQRTVIHIWNHLTEFVPCLGIPDPFQRWARSIARWNGISEVRDRAIHNKRHQGFGDIGASDDLDRRSDGHGDEVELLPHDLRELVRLSKFGYSVQESAELIGVGYSAIRKRIQRFRNSRIREDA
jgi:DNA-directed RNA polymerase specialized sigma24 family protein